MSDNPGMNDYSSCNSDDRESLVGQSTMVTWPKDDQDTLLPQGTVVAISPKRSTTDRVSVPAATEADLVKQRNMFERLKAMRNASPRPPKRRAGQRRGGAFVTPPRANLALDVIPTLPEHKTRGRTRVRLVTPAMSTSGYPDMNAMLAEIMRNDRSVPTEVEHSSTGAVIRRSHRTTASDLAG